MLKQVTNKQRGFTLIELLVVIAIIGILSGIVVTSLGGQRARARDSRKVSEIQSVALALQIYYDQNGKYPTTLFGGTDSLPTSLLPKEPVDTAGNSYLIYKTYTTSDRTTLDADCEAGTPNCQGFHLAFELEQTDAVILSGDDDVDGAGSGAIQGATDTEDCAGATTGDGLDSNSSTKFCYDITNK